MNLLLDHFQPTNTEKNRKAREYYGKNRKRILARRSWKGKMERRALRLLQTDHMFVEAAFALEPARISA